MAESETNQVAEKPVLHNLDRFPHRELVGREWEITQLERFLKGEQLHMHATYSPPIMLVVGPRGIGKSALVREVARRCVHDQKLGFKAVFLLHREKFTDFLIGDKDALPLSEGSSRRQQFSIEDIGQLLDADEWRCVDTFHRDGPFPNGDERDGAASSLNKLLSYQPYVLVVDDFDEKDNVNSADLCRLLEERVHSPNKVILTTRLPDHQFSDGVFKILEIGLLDQEEVKRLVECDCCQSTLSYQLPSQDLYQAAQFAWEWSGGLPEVITQLLIPWLQRKGQRLRSTPRWLKELAQFAEEYCVLTPELSDDEKYILLALTLQEHLRDLEIEELARSLGYRLEDEGDDDSFYDALYGLYRRRLIGRRSERTQKDQPQSSLVWKWTLLPFAIDFVKKQLTDYERIDFHLYHADRWSRFVEGSADAPKIVEHHLDTILPCFSWCYEHEEWERVVNLGKFLSKALWDVDYKVSQSPMERFRFEEVCKRTSEAARKRNDWWTQVNQLTMLAYLYLSVKNVSKARMTIEQAVKLLTEAEENGKAGEAHWAATAYVYAQLQLAQGNVADTQKWLEKATHSYQSQDDLEGAAVSGTDLARLHRKRENFEQALILAQRAKENALQARAIKVAVRANTMMGEVAYYQGDLEKCIELLKEALELAKEAGLTLVADKLREYIDFAKALFRAQQGDGKFDAADRIDSLLGARLLWGALEENLICPVCSKEFEPEDLFAERLWRCPTCDIFYHIGCLIDNKCPSCSMPQ